MPHARFSGPEAVAARETKFAFWASMGDLLALVMRSGAPQLRLRIGVALVLVFVGKLSGVIAPVMLGDAINTLSPAAQVSAKGGGVAIGSVGEEGEERFGGVEPAEAEGDGLGFGDGEEEGEAFDGDLWLATAADVV